MAILLIPQVDALIIALVLAILLWASRTLFGDLIGGLARSIPVVGQYISGVGFWIDTQILTYIGAWIQAGITPFGQAVGNTIDTVEGWIVQTIVLLSNVVAQIYAASSGAISTAVQTSLATLSAAITALQGSTAATIAGIEARVLATAQQMVGQLAAEVTGLRDATGAQFAQIQSMVQTLLGQQATQVEAQLRSAIVQAEAEVRGIEAGIDAKVGALTQSIDGIVGTAVAGALAGVQGLEREIVGAIPRIDGRIAEVAGTAAATAVLAQATAATLARELEECITPMCDAYHGSLDGVNAVNTLLSAGVIAAMIAAAIHDPEGSANAVASLADEIVTPALAVVGG